MFPDAPLTFPSVPAGLIDIQGGAFVNGGWGGGNWSANLADMNIASGAVFDVWDGGAIRVDGTHRCGLGSNGSNSGGLRWFTVGVDGGSGTFSGVIGGGTGRAGNNAISLTKEGSGTQILSGNNTYAGTTTVTAARSQIGDGSTTGSLGTGNVSITGNLTFNRSDNYSTGSGQVFSGAGTITKEGAGDVVFNGAVDHAMSRESAPSSSTTAWSAPTTGVSGTTISTSPSTARANLKCGTATSHWQT